MRREEGTTKKGHWEKLVVGRWKIRELLIKHRIAAFQRVQGAGRQDKSKGEEKGSPMSLKEGKKDSVKKEV